MLNAITTKIEIDVMQANELDKACQLASAQTMPAMVVHQAMTQQALMMRGRYRGRFKIITPVDWTKGETYGMNKLRGLNVSHFETDGFEIMLTSGKSEIDTRKEAKLISDFIYNHVGPLKEVRYVLGCFMRQEDDWLRICSILKDIRTPTMLRTDHHLKMQATKASVKAQRALVAKIKQMTPVPIKISGNIDSIRTIAGCITNAANAGAQRFAVSLPQAVAIVGELQKQPDCLRELLEDSAKAAH